MSAQFLVTNIGELVTFEPLAKSRNVTRVTNADVGKKQNAWLAVRDGKVVASGSGEPPAEWANVPVRDASGGLVMPGFVDAHTHPVFAGSRAHEFALRLDGATYLEIAEKGGGIRSTVEATRKASHEELLRLVTPRLRRFLETGITTVEVKSGYGLSVDQELKQLEVLNEAKKKTPQTLSVTCLALHARPPEASSLADYVDEINTELLPRVAQEGLADWVDAFIETGYYDAETVAPHFAKAQELGLGIRIHADEFSDASAARVAAEWKAASADHLQCAAPENLDKMAEAGVTATILPGTSLYTGLAYTNARAFLDRGIPVALASDFNPGSCRIDNLPLLATVGALKCGFRPAEALSAVTFTAAHSLNLADRKGALAPGYDADFLIYDLESSDDWLASIGGHKPRQVWIGGSPVIE